MTERTTDPEDVPPSASAAREPQQHAATAAVPSAGVAEPPVLHCTWHPDRETVLRCARCDRPMCTDCARRHPVGLRCKECIKETRSPLYKVEPRGYVLGAVVGAAAGVAAAVVAQMAFALIGGFFQLFLAFILGSSLGTGIGDVVGRSAGRKRGRGLMMVAGGAVIVGTAIVAVVTWQFGGLSRVPLLGLIVYTVLATSAAAARLR